MIEIEENFVGDDVEVEVRDDVEVEVRDEAEVEGITPEPTNVPLSALQEERGKRQDAQQKNIELESRLKVLEAEKPAVTTQEGPLDPNDPNPALVVTDDDYDFMTPSEQRNLNRAEAEWNVRESGRIAQLNQDKQYHNIETDARQRFNTEAMGENLDYGSVIKTGEKWLTENDVIAVQMSADPAKMFYDLCRERCPYLPDIKPSTPPTSNENDVTPPVTPPVRHPALSNEFAEDNIGNLASSFVDGENTL